MTATEWFTKVNGLVVTSPYGVRIHPVTKIKSHHNGIDFGGRNVRGKDILCPKAGIVTNSGFDAKGYGYYIGVTVESGHVLVFAHLDSRTVKKGDKVRYKSVIGKLGNTGKSTGPHLHFQVNKPGGGTRGKNYWGNPDEFDFGGEDVKFVLVNTWSDVPFAKRLMEKLGCFMAWRTDNGELVGNLADASEVYVCGGKVTDIPAGPKVINLSGANAFATVANIEQQIKGV